jgi:hypothetical protein
MSVTVSSMIPQLPTSLDSSLVPQSYDEFERRLVLTLGATVGGESLTRALGYPSQDAFRKAHQRGRLPVTTFELEGRRGRFALVVDIAGWLWCQRDGTRAQPKTQGGGH